MKNTTSISIELNLFIKSNVDGRIYSSFSTNLVGIGTNKENAISNALNDFNPKSNELVYFYNDAQKKIVNYFELKCDDFINQAELFTKMGKFEEAIALLMSVPNVSIPCYKKITSKSIEIYNLYVIKTCNSILLTAKSFKANRDFDEALKTLCLLDPASSCFKEVNSIVKEIENELKEMEKQAFQEKQKQYNDKIEIEKLQLNAIKEIAISYYSSFPKNYNYFEVVYH